jgi:hypothetical protein
VLGGVLGEGGESLAGRVCPHTLCGGTSADDSGSFIMVFKKEGTFLSGRPVETPDLAT